LEQFYYYLDNLVAFLTSNVLMIQQQAIIKRQLETTDEYVNFPI